MPEPNRVVIDRIEWKSVLPVLRLSSAFKHALQPGKLVVALVAVLAVHLSGVVLDQIWEGVVDVRPGESLGIYETLLRVQAVGLEQLADATLRFDFGRDQGVITSLYAIVIDTPRLMVTEHPGFMLVFALVALLVFLVASGVLARMSASQVCQGRLTTLGDALRYIQQRWQWHLLTPLMPVALIGVVGAVLALVGVVFFNLPGTDVIGALLYGVLLLLGFVMALVAGLLILALFLMPPALSVEGGDGFDAIARSFNYILFRPWQFAFYVFVSVFYLVIVYLIISAAGALAAYATHEMVGLGSIATVEMQDGYGLATPRYEAVVSRGGEGAQGVTAGVSGWIVTRWFGLLPLIITAILFSTFCCLQTQVYVLLRRSADGTPMDQCDGGEAADLWAEEPVTLQALEQSEADGATEGKPEAEG